MYIHINVVLIFWSASPPSISNAKQIVQVTICPSLIHVTSPAMIRQITCVNI